MPKTKSEEKMVLISVHIPRQMLEELDELVRSGVFPSRSEAIRVAIRDLLLRER
ncbi:ribbon-helix-helix domain-containing protein, partial [Caldivirga sp.]